MAYYDANGNELVAAGAPPQPPSRPSLFLPDGCLDQWVAARSASSGTTVPVVGIGDSLLRGHSATARSGNHFWARLMLALGAKYGSAGEGYHAVADTLDPQYAPGGYSADVAPCWTFSAGWQDWVVWGVGGQARVAPAGGTATGVFAGSGVDVVCALYGGGAPFTVTVDGVPYDKNGVANGGGGSPSCNGATTSPAVLVSIRGLAAGQHTVVLSSPTANGLVLHGIVAYSGLGRGILPLRMGFSGKSLAQTLINRSVDSARASVEGWSPQPKLLIVEHIVNDMQQGVAFDTYEYHARRLCDSARICGASIVFLIPFIGMMAGNWTNLAYAAHYIDRVYMLARRYGAAVLDINAAWEGLGPAQSALLLAGSGNSHPNDAGHADIAGRLQSLLV